MFDEPSHVCVVCTRPMETSGYACRGCEQRIDRDLAAIPDLYALLPGVLERTSSNGPKVSGSREAPIPLRIDPVDLALPARVPNPTRDENGDPHYLRMVPKVRLGKEEDAVDVTATFDGRQITQKVRPREYVRDELGAFVMVPDEDDTSRLSVATILDQWVRDWRDTLCPDHHLPHPAVWKLVEWLRNRLPQACDHHPAIDEFAAEIRALVRTLTHISGRGQRSGEYIGRCPAVMRDDSHCLARLYADPYVDRVACGRCGSSWARHQWLHLAALQQDIGEAS